MKTIEFQCENGHEFWSKYYTTEPDLEGGETEHCSCLHCGCDAWTIMPPSQEFPCTSESKGKERNRKPKEGE